MSAAGTLLLYGLIGLGVAVALFLRQRSPGMAALAVAFWPLLIPFLLGGTTISSTIDGGGRIARVQAEVLQALGRLEGLAEEVLAPELRRVRGLTEQLEAMSRRIARMDELLQSPQLAQAGAEEQLRELFARQ